MKKLLEVHRRFKNSGNIIFIVLLRFLFYKLMLGKSLLLHQKANIKGKRNVFPEGRLEVGVAYNGMVHKKDRTFLRVQGKLQVKGNYSIGRGCRFDIGKNGVVIIGIGGYMNCNNNVVIMHQLTIGDNCSIAWGCQFLDEDFHEIDYPGRKSRKGGIFIGDNVWIASGVKIYKGSFIPDGCVIASNSIVKGVFTKKNALIGGHPAKVIKEDVKWE